MYPHKYTVFFHHRFVSMMPTPVSFTVFSFLLRVVDGTGTAMFMTVSYTLLTQSYPEKKGTIVVSDLQWNPTTGATIGNQHFVC